MKFNRVSILLFFLSLFLFQGCSIRTDFYIQNFTNDTKLITINYNYIVEPHFEYSKGILNPKVFNNSDDSEFKTINPSQIKDFTLELKLSPITTTRIAKSVNYRWLNSDINYIIIDNEKIDVKNLAENSERIIIYLRLNSTPL